MNTVLISHPIGTTQAQIERMHRTLQSEFGIECKRLQPAIQYSSEIEPPEMYSQQELIELGVLIGMLMQSK